MKPETLFKLALLALVGWLVKCLMDGQKTTTASVEQVTERLASDHRDSVKMISHSFTTSMTEVSGRMVGLIEVLMLGRDLPPTSENSPTNSSGPEPSNEPEIDLSDLPETAAWALEEEMALTQMPWQSSTPPPDSELTL